MRSILSVKPWLLGTIAALPWIATTFLFDEIVNHPWIMGVSMLTWVIYMAWLFCAFSILAPLVPPSTSIPTSRIRINFIIVTAYLIVVTISMMTDVILTIFSSSWSPALVVVHLYCIYALIFLAYYTAKVMLLSKGSRDVHVGDTMLLLVQLCLFPISAYFLQKRLIKITKG